jgi:hypothetical protein
MILEGVTKAVVLVLLLEIRRGFFFLVSEEKGEVNGGHGIRRWKEWLQGCPVPVVTTRS